MRVNPNPMPDLLAAVNEAQLEEEVASLQVSTGKSVSKPSDNPTAAALLVENNDQATYTSGSLQTLSAVQSQLSTADSTLSSMTTALQQAISLGIEGANGTESASDQAAIAEQLQGIQTQLISLANTTYEGNYLFSGTATGTQPYTADANDPSGVSYAGNADSNQVAVGNGCQITTNVPGSQLFSASGNDVFLAVNNLITAMQTNTGIESAVNALSSASSYLSTQRVLYGNGMSEATSETTYLNTAKLQISQQETTLGSADEAAAATNLSQANTAMQAALSAISKMSQNNLFNYL
jgi:flagellar hook-associated protein 3 FlgL